VTGGWRRLHNEELHILNASLKIIRLIKLRRMRWMRHIAHMGKINAYNIFVVKLEGKRPLERPKCR
jgi:hypothetical protein